MVAARRTSSTKSFAKSSLFKSAIVQTPYFGNYLT
jgi:hypothetical protein